MTYVSTSDHEADLAPVQHAAGHSAVADQRPWILGVPISALTMPAAISGIDAMIESRMRGYICVCTVHSVMEARRSPEMKAAVAQSTMSTPDGMPLVWLLRRQTGVGPVEQVCGPELLPAYLSWSRGAQRRHFFYGGRDGTAELLRRRMEETFPGALIVGTLEPPMGSLEELCDVDTADRINAAQPDIVWIGLSTPKQDMWMARMRRSLDAPVLIGVGAAFDFHAGNLKRSPRWMSQLGLEWLYRLYREPRRLWKRYLVNNVGFVTALATEPRIKRRASRGE